MQNNLVRKLLFGAVAVVCALLALQGISLLRASAMSGELSAKGVFYLAAGIILGIPVMIGYYYYMSRAEVTGPVEYNSLEILAAAAKEAETKMPASEQNKTANVTEKEEDNDAAHTTSNQG